MMFLIVAPRKLVDALVVIADDAQVLALLCKQTDKQILRVDGILVLVHHDVPKPVLIVLQNVRARNKERNGICDQVVKIHCVGVFEAGLIELVGFFRSIPADSPRRYAPEIRPVL